MLRVSRLKRFEVKGALRPRCCGEHAHRHHVRPPRSALKISAHQLNPKLRITFQRFTISGRTGSPSTEPLSMTLGGILIMMLVADTDTDTDSNSALGDRLF
jgi:hypothetical protein